MPDFPQPGGCLCGAVRYALREDPVTLYVCHCTDCQTESGASFTLSMIVRRETVEVHAGRPRASEVELPDGRRKGGHACPRCTTRLFGPSRIEPLWILAPGTLDDTSWVHPVAHIWTRSAQPWIEIPAGVPRFEQAADDAGTRAMVRAWRERAAC